MDFDVSQKGFSRLDFNEIKRVGRLVEFDIVACARTKKSCGPGCDWLVQDKRYYTLMLIKHIDALIAQKQYVTEEVLAWYEKGKAAAQEYSQMEQRMCPVLELKKKQKQTS